MLGTGDCAGASISELTKGVSLKDPVAKLSLFAVQGRGAVADMATRGYMKGRIDLAFLLPPNCQRKLVKKQE